MANQGIRETVNQPTLEEKVVVKPPESDLNRSAGNVGTYIVLVFLSAALISPWVYKAITTFFPNSFLADQPFHRYVNRCMIAAGLIGLIPLLKSFRAAGGQPVRLGLHFRNLRFCLPAFLLGIGMITLAGVVAVLVGGRTLDFDHTAATWLKHFKNAAIAAVLVSLFEELLFRGGLFGALRRQEGFIPSAFISSACFGIVHFLRKPANPDEIMWNSGLLVLKQMLRGFFDFHALFPGLLTLTLLGMILCLLFERSKTIYAAYGLHAGIILGVKTYGFLTRPSSNANQWVWGSDRPVDGWLNFILVCVLLILVNSSLRKKHEPVHFD